MRCGKQLVHVLRIGERARENGRRKLLSVRWLGSPRKAAVGGSTRSVLAQADFLLGISLVDVKLKHVLLVYYRSCLAPKGMTTAVAACLVAKLAADGSGKKTDRQTAADASFTKGHRNTCSRITKAVRFFFPFSFTTCNATYSGLTTSCHVYSDSFLP